jgi:Ca2+-binding EF-hand superfamily protein
VAEVLANALGKSFEPEMVTKLFESADTDGTGTVTIGELKAFAKAQESNLKI